MHSTPIFRRWANGVQLTWQGFTVFIRDEQWGWIVSNMEDMRGAEGPSLSGLPEVPIVTQVTYGPYCSHGVGHENRIHGCDGCCTDAVERARMDERRTNDGRTTSRADGDIRPRSQAVPTPTKIIHTEERGIEARSLVEGIVEAALVDEPPYSPPSRRGRRVSPDFTMREYEGERMAIGQEPGGSEPEGGQVVPKMPEEVSEDTPEFDAWEHTLKWITQ